MKTNYLSNYILIENTVNINQFWRMLTFFMHDKLCFFEHLQSVQATI